jgi:signal transduction histidine kinase
MCDFELDRKIIKDVLGNAQSEIMRMARMVDSAMRQSALQESHEGMKPLDIAELLREGAETYRALLERQGNNLTLDIPETLPPILGSTDILLHVLSNLLSNANRYTRNGDIMISAAVKIIESGTDNEKQVLKVKASDNGTGIAPEILPDVFQRGVSDAGTGLGLSICKNAIEAHGGTIGVESTPGYGTTVWFTIPIYRGEDDGKQE